MPQPERAELLTTVFKLDGPAQQALEDKLAQIREQDYAIVVDELDVGAHSIAAPIRDHRGQVVAAISIAGPSHRFTDAAITRYVQLIVQAGANLAGAGLCGFATESKWRTPANNALNLFSS